MIWIDDRDAIGQDDGGSNFSNNLNEDGRIVVCHPQKHSMLFSVIWVSCKCGFMLSVVCMLFVACLFHWLLNLL